MSLIMMVQFLVLTAIISGTLIFVLKKVLFDSTQGAVNRLNRETEDVRSKQKELNEKIKEANEELSKRKAEAEALVSKMKEEASQAAAEEREKIVKKSREDADEIITKAQKTRDDMRKELERKMDMRAVDFTALVLKEILTEKSYAAFNESLVEDFINGLKDISMDVIKEDVTDAEILTNDGTLSERCRAHLSDVLEGKLGRKLGLSIKEDKGLMAGIVLRFGSLALNGSLANMVKEKGEEVKEKIEKGMLEL